MNKTGDLEALPRYVYGITAVVTVLALLMVAYIYAQSRKTFQLERQLTAIHLPSIVALNVLDHELGEIENSLIRASLPPALQAGEVQVQDRRGLSPGQAGGHMHLIKTRLGVIRDLQPGAPGTVFEFSTAQLLASVGRLERLLEGAQDVDPGEADSRLSAALTHTQNLVEQLNRLHLKESAELGEQLSRKDRESSRIIGGVIALTLLLGGLAVARLLFLLRGSLAAKTEADAALRKYRNHLEELVAERNRELEASNRELESYSYSIAHDLRAPLRTVTSFSQILQQDALDKLDKDEQQCLERVIKAGKYMAQLIDDILELSRISRTRLESEHFDLSRLARDSASHLDEAYPDRQVEWRIQEGLKVRGSRRLLETAVGNLFGNAWKYTEKTDPACIEFGAVRQHGEIVYYVKDNGSGFDMQYADKLFKPFQRLHSPGDYSGTGVGLATVERVIQRHGGKIWAESEEGRGATFLFTLPSRE